MDEKFIHQNVIRHPIPETTRREMKVSMQLCPHCRGAGYLRKDVPFGDPLFGKALECGCKIAQKKEKQQARLRDLSGLGDFSRFQNATFASFHSDLPGCRNAFIAATNFAYNPKGWLALLGPKGCGKTHLAVAIAKERIEQGDTVLILSAPDILDHLREGYATTEYDARFEEMKMVDLLIIDDYGAQNDTKWANEKFYQLFNHRYNRSAATVVTTNDMKLEQIDSRIESRLSDKELVTMIIMHDARDFRKHGATPG